MVPEPPDESGAAKTVSVTVRATEDLSAWAVVTAHGKQADSGNPSAHMGRIIGIIVAPIRSGSVGQAILSGEITNSDWNWVMGQQVYLTGRQISSVSPTTGFSQQIGAANAPTKLVVALSAPMLL